MRGPGRPKMRDGQIFSVYLSNEAIRLIDHERQGLSRSEFLDRIILMKDGAELADALTEVKKLKSEVKRLRQEVKKLKRENALLEKKLAEYEAVDEEDPHLSAKEKRIRKILRRLEEYIGRTYEEAMFDMGIAEKEIKEILWNYFKADAKPASWLLTGLADVVIDVRDGVHKGWFGTGIIRHKSEYEAWKEEMERKKEERRLRMGISIAGSGGAAMVEVRK